MLEYFTGHDAVHQILAVTILCVSVFIVITHNFARKEASELRREIRDMHRAMHDTEFLTRCIVCNEHILDPTRFSSVIPPARKPKPMICAYCKRGIIAFRSIVFDEDDKDK